MNNKYRLELLGITYNQIESGVYALILQQVGTSRRIPIIIGFPEAQAIECKLQDIKTPRPLTHDIMIKALSAFGITLKSVLIKRLPNGVFGADISLSDGFKDFDIDARSSDAVALAIRCGAPIFTTEDVLLEAGFDPEQLRKNRQKTESAEPTPEPRKIETEFDGLSTEQLIENMAKAAENEDYEEAARIKAVIEKRKNNDSSHPS